jgi:hypothetical protein
LLFLHTSLLLFYPIIGFLPILLLLLCASSLLFCPLVGFLHASSLLFYSLMYFSEYLYKMSEI